MLKATNNICFANSTKAWGGGEKWHYEVSTYLKNRGYKVFFVCGKHGELQAKIAESGVELLKIKVGNLSFFNPLKIIVLSRWFKRNRINTVILNLPSDLKLIGTAARLARVSKIFYRRGSAIPIKNSFLNRLLFRHVVSDIIANSVATKKTILEKNPKLFPQDKIHVIYNGLKIPNKLQEAGTTYSPILKIGGLGRLVLQKGFDYFIKIVQILQQQNHHFKVIIGGSGPLEVELKEQAEKCGVDKHINFIGFVEDSLEFMRSIDIFVLPSRWEGFGYVIAEAMLMQKPVVAFNISSNPELIEHNKTGYLAEPFSCEQMAAYINTLLNDEHKRTQFGQEGQKVVLNKFDFEKNIHKLMEII